MEIPLARPDIGPAEIEAVLAVLKTPHLSLGPKVGEFEDAFAAYCGTRYAAAINSGTAGLHLCLAAIGVGPGDEVITTPFSFVASSNCILFQGAKPVLADIDPETWNIDPARVAAAVTARTKAVIPVDVFGQPADMDPIRAIARKAGLRIVEDSCEALGARYHGRFAGSLGDAGVFGFYPNKQITTGEGGMIVTDDEAIVRIVRSMRNQGRAAGATWLSHERLGYNYRLSDINCAIGLAQLGRVDEFIARRAAVAGMYLERLADDERLSTQRIIDGVDMSWFVFVVRLADSYSQDDRDRILNQLRERGIGCSNYFTPIHLQPFMVEQFGYGPGDFPVCEAVAARTIALPFHPQLTEREVETVCRELKAILDK
ncbi:MAG: DegT/DnrJ/EryC1/StrS family aminotransferase [Phycisphaerae bacterium]|nr:DegT/DnrJ/EryC1/StrS family aminotransferase [Phycisphaerae bacterium]